MHSVLKFRGSVMKVSLSVTCLVVVTSLAFIFIHSISQPDVSPASNESKVSDSKAELPVAGRNVAEISGPRTTTAAFVQAINGEASILRENDDGKLTVTPLSTSLPVFKSFGLSADGRTLLYTSLKNGIPSGELYVEDLTNSRIRKVTSDLVLSAAWSPLDPKRLCYTFSTGQDIGLAVTSIGSGKSDTLVAGVFADQIRWDESGSGIHYLETKNTDETLELTARVVTVDKFKRISPDVHVPLGFPKLGRFAALKQLKSSSHRSIGPANSCAFAAVSPDHDHELLGFNLLGNDELFAYSNASGKMTSMGRGQLVKILQRGALVSRPTPTGSKLDYVNWHGISTNVATTTLAYNLPLSHSRMIQGGTGYAAPGSCGITAHAGAMAYAYDFESQNIGEHAMAAADGLVVYTASAQTCNTVDTNCPDYSATCSGTFFGNIVVLQHADGTYTKYAHMEADSVQAEVGTTVCQGLYIGRQGHTGSTNGTLNSCGDHLHFQRQSSPDVFGQSIPVDFADVPSNPLSCGSIYDSTSSEVSHSISPTAQSFGIPGGNGTVNVSSTGCGWTAVSNNSWLTITSGSSGTGNGVVTYTVADNSNSGNRTGTLIAGGHIFTVSQTGGGVTNQAPSVSAGADQTITLPNAATLAGSATDDGLPNPPGMLSSTWSKVSGPGTVSFSNPNSPNTSANFSLAGIYTLRLTVTDGDLTSTDDVSIIVNVVNGGGSLASNQAAPANVNLTTEGTADWTHWGLITENSLDRKAGVTPQISDFTRVGSVTPLRYTDNSNTYSWSDGTPTASVTNTQTGIYLYGVGNGFQLTIPADLTSRTLKLYIGAWMAHGRMEASLSDGSASPIIDTTLDSQTGTTNRVFTFNYRSASAGQTLTIRWTLENSYHSVGNITFQAASLAVNSGSVGGSLTASIVAPSNANLTSEGLSDWAHWGLSSATSFDHKANITSLISNFATIGSIGAVRYPDNPNSFSWSDGTPTANASNTTTGDFIYGAGNGFQLTVPADTTDRTLRLYVGVWSAQGKLEASLSDGSAPIYLDTSVVNQTGTTTRVYILNYRAASNGQTLTIKWTVTTSFNTWGNVTLQAATLAPAGSAPTNQPPVVNAGPDQSITLPATATLNGTTSDDGLPNPPGSLAPIWSKVSGPGTVAFGNANALSTTASFNAAGVYVLRLTVSDGALSSTDDLTVTVNSASGSGALSGSSLAPPSNTDLTTEGSSDWAHWGLASATSFDHKANTTSLISNFATIGSIAALRYDNNPNTFSWSNGTPTATATNTMSGVYISGVGNGFQLTVPADTTDRVLRIYTGVWSAQGRLEATLSDGSAPIYVDTSLVNQTGTATTVYVLNYRAGSNVQTLTVKWTVTAAFNGWGNVTLQAATLSVPGSAPTNQPPVVNAGLDQSITLPATASLSGSASDDGLPNPPGSLTPTWSMVSGPGTVSFGNANALSTTASFSVAGIYVLRLTVNDGALSRTDDVTITVNSATGGGSLTVTTNAPPLNTNLTNEGSADWAHWGLTSATSFNHRSNVTSLISNYTTIGSISGLRYANNPNNFSWNNGTPTTNASNTPTGLYVYGTGNGFQVTVPADLANRTLRLYLGVWSAQGRLEASLSDGSAPIYVDTSLVNQTGTSNSVYVISYRAAGNGQTLTIKWTVTTSFNTWGNVTLQAATSQ